MVSLGVEGNLMALWPRTYWIIIIKGTVCSGFLTHVLIRILAIKLSKIRGVLILQR